MLAALSTVGNKSELLWFCGKGSPAGTDCGHLALGLALGCSTGSRSLGAPSSTLPSRVGEGKEGRGEGREGGRE